MKKSSPITREEKATTWDRRIELLNYLREHKRTTVSELANEFRVNGRTILRDLTVLMQRYAVETVRGRYGGVYLRDTDRTAKKLMESQKQTLRELLAFANTKQQQDILEIIDKFGR